jgi:hypothetical protein
MESTSEMKLRISVQKFIDGRLDEEDSIGADDNLKEFIGDGFIETVIKNPGATSTMTLKDVYSIYYCVHLDLEGQRVVYPDGTVGTEDELICAHFPFEQIEWY